MCIFCKIVSKEINANIVYQDDLVTAFRDVNPQSPVHILVVPNEHIPTIAGLSPERAGLVGEMVRTATELAQKEGIDGKGFRLVLNAGPDGGQTVDHIHVHLLGGRAMQWPPG